MPNSYAVRVPDSGGVDDGFDPEGGGYGISILIKAPEVARSIPGYKTRVRVGSAEHHQALYVMLAPTSDFQRPLSAIAQTAPLDEHSQLHGEIADSFTWEVLEDTANGQRHWGTCADQFTGTGSFDCLRTLRVEDLVMTYPIDQTNLHLYQQVDDLLREKVDQWRCEDSEIPIKLD